jgi:hypothetical protein
MPGSSRRGGLLARSLTVAGLALAACGTVTAAQAATAGHVGTAGSGHGKAVWAKAFKLRGHSEAKVYTLGGRGHSEAKAYTLGGGAHPGTLPGSPLCAPHSVATRVAITQKTSPGPFMPIESQRTLPWGSRPEGVRVVTSASQVTALGKALCALPATSHRPIMCPGFLTQGHYQLSFTVDGRVAPMVTVQETGCQSVLGLGGVRSAAGRPGFWTLLGSMSGPYRGGPVHLPGQPILGPGPVLPGGPILLPGPPSVPPGQGGRLTFGPGPVHLAGR